MIDQKQILLLLKKTRDKFIDINVIAEILKFNNEQAIKALKILETQGYISESGIEGCWLQSIRGQLLSEEVLKKEYKVDTLRKHLSDLIKRAKTINASRKYPDRVVCIKVLGEYPIENRSYGIEIAFFLSRKNITDEKYELAANRLRKQYKGSFDNTVEYLFYPENAIVTLLKSRSHVLKLIKYEKEDIDKVKGNNLLK